MAAVYAGASHREAAELFGVSAASVSRGRTREREQSDAPPKAPGGDPRSQHIKAHHAAVMASLGPDRDATIEKVRLDLAAQGQSDPFDGAIYVFRAKRADRLKLLFWDGTGVCLLAKRLEENAFCWPKIEDGVMRLTSAQLSALLEGLDWKRVRPGKDVSAPLLPG